MLCYYQIMKIVFTKHALEKFNHLSVVKLGLKRKHIKEALVNPDKILEDEPNVKLLLKRIDERHNVRVVYKEIDDIMVIITFHPVEKGRYEKK